MKKDRYAVEGVRLRAPDNLEYISTPEGLARAMARGEILEAVARVCDGDLNLSVDLGGVRGVIPKSEMLTAAPGTEIKDIAIISRVGKPVCFKVTGIEEDVYGRPTAFLSRKAAQDECMREYLTTLTPGDLIPARITHMEHFGAFVDVGCGLISLLPIDAISVSRIPHPRDRFEVGDLICTVVQEIDRETGRMYVSHKELLGSWEENAARFEIGTTVSGIVRSVESYGVFVELAPNLAGLAEYSDNVREGDCASVYIKNIIPEKMKIKLVLIDSFSSPGKRPFTYFIDGSKTDHISRWQYSPACCPKIVESVFE